MAENWMEEQALQQRRQPNVLDSGGGGVQLSSGRVLRSGRRLATETATFWDIVLLGSGFEELNIVPSAVRPVRPYLADVASGGALSAGDVVSVRLSGGARTAQTSVETGPDLEDYAMVAPGQHTVVSAGGGNCFTSVMNGTLFG